MGLGALLVVPVALAMLARDAMRRHRPPVKKGHPRRDPDPEPRLFPAGVERLVAIPAPGVGLTLVGKDAAGDARWTTTIRADDGYDAV